MRCLDLFVVFWCILCKQVCSFNDYTVDTLRDNTCAFCAASYRLASLPTVFPPKPFWVFVISARRLANAHYGIVIGLVA